MTIINVLNTWLKSNTALLFNASSLVATTVITAGLGFFYWWLVAQWFPPEAVGLASAAISAMMLLGTIGVLGFGTLLIGEIPRQRDNKGSLIVTSLAIVSLAGCIFGLLFARVAPWISSNLRPIGENIGVVVLFSLGVSLTSVTLVLDQALIGLLRGEYQLGRNIVFALVKLSAILILGIWLAEKNWMIIYTSWIIGNMASMAILGMIFIFRQKRIFYRPKWGLIRVLGRPALFHHSLNLSLQVPVFALPILVTILLSTRMNAYFYVAWMVASLIYIVPVAFSTVLYAVSSKDPTVLVPTIRLTLLLSLGFGLGANVFLFGFGGQILQLFGPEYAEQAGLILRVLGFGVFPLIVRVHYIAIYRITRQLAKPTKLVIITGLIALSLAAIGARIGGLYGLSVGWVAGMCLEAIIMTPVLVSVAVFKKGLPLREEDYEDQSSPRIDSASTDSSGIDI